MSIRVLDPRVAQQVAAGEVVDRPASVVKELVENALDAGASRVEVELDDGGTSRILVRDDGSGMPPDDARLSVLRHATSKIRAVKDIEAVTTLGFRGEALPSIASVSSFSLTTSTGEGSGTRVVVEGGAEAEVSAASHPKGTTVVVDRLFYNVPARRAFLRGPRAERAAISEVLTHLAIAHPNVAFRLTEKGRDYLLGRRGDLLERLAQIHGVAKARAMRKVEYESGAFAISGYAALPSLNGGEPRSPDDLRERPLRAGREPPPRPRRRLQGDRPGRPLPARGLEISVDPRRVDVNVHPTKQVVRFSEERAARDAVAAAVRTAIEWRPPATVTTPAPFRTDLHPGTPLAATSYAPRGKPPAPPRTGPPTPPGAGPARGPRAPRRGLAPARRGARGVRGAAGARRAAGARGPAGHRPARGGLHPRRGAR